MEDQYVCNINKEMITKAHFFSKKVVETTDYSKRNQVNKDKIRNDHFNSKIGELGVYHILNSNFSGIELSEPDFEIYLVKNKSWEPDLKDHRNNISIGVKSHDVDSNFPVSFVCQLEDKGIFKNIYENYHLAFTTVDYNKSIVKLEAFLSVEELKKNDLFQPMKLSKLSSKRAIYLDDNNYNNICNYERYIFPEIWMRK